MNNLALTKVQVYLLKKSFSSIDLDGNGVLDREEMTELFKKVFPKEEEEAITGAVDECFTLYDDDGDGVIDFEEFCNGLANALMEMGKDQQQEREEDKEEVEVIDSKKKRIEM